MLKLFMDIAEYLSDNGIKVPIWIFWVLLALTVVGLLIAGYKKFFKPLHENLRKLAKKINKIDEIDEIKATQTEAITQSIEADNKLEAELSIINKKIDSVTKMFITKQINDMRQEILNFGSGLMNGQKYDKEAYDHVLEIHNDYEKILKDNNMTNGRVTTTMEIIKDSYKNNFKKA